MNFHCRGPVFGNFPLKMQPFQWNKGLAISVIRMCYLFTLVINPFLGKILSKGFDENQGIDQRTQVTRKTCFGFTQIITTLRYMKYLSSSVVIKFDIH